MLVCGVCRATLLSRRARSLMAQLVPLRVVHPSVISVGMLLMPRDLRPLRVDPVMTRVRQVALSLRRETVFLPPRMVQWPQPTPVALHLILVPRRLELNRDLVVPELVMVRLRVVPLRPRARPALVALRTSRTRFGMMILLRPMVILVTPLVHPAETLIRVMGMARLDRETPCPTLRWAMAHVAIDMPRVAFPIPGMVSERSQKQAVT